MAGRTPHKALGLTQPLGCIDVSFIATIWQTRDSTPNHSVPAFPSTSTGRLSIRTTSSIPDVPLAPALNELFDYGRPSRVDLAVLVDRGGRELPIAARYCAHTLAEPLAADQSLQLERNRPANSSWG